MAQTKEKKVTPPLLNLRHFPLTKGNRRRKVWINNRIAQASGKDSLRILHIDGFGPEYSNHYWLAAFRRQGSTITFDIENDDQQYLLDLVRAFKPDHIHLGGHIQRNLLPVEMVRAIKREGKCTISSFYGDMPPSTYHTKIAPYCETIYSSNKTFVDDNNIDGFGKFAYLPCPTDPEVFKHHDVPEKYNIVFIGNNSDVNAARLPLIRRLVKESGMVISGNNWDLAGLQSIPAVYGPEYARLCSSSRISLGILAQQFRHIKRSFSNRVMNTLGCGAFIIVTYTPELEKVFENRKHLVWYKTEDELIREIQYYLEHDNERSKIAKEGQKLAYSKYTYNHAVARILKDCGHL